jgi:hypothetical protein
MSASLNSVEQAFLPAEKQKCLAHRQTEMSAPPLCEIKPYA